MYIPYVPVAVVSQQAKQLIIYKSNDYYFQPKPRPKYIYCHTRLNNSKTVGLRLLKNDRMCNYEHRILIVKEIKSHLMDKGLSVHDIVGFEYEERYEI